MPISFLLILLIVGLAAVAPLLALIAACLYFTGYRMICAHATALGATCGLLLMLGWVLITSLVTDTQSISLSTAAVSFGAGFSVGFVVMLAWHIARRPRPNNSFKPSPLRGLGAGAQD